uniref:Uncharacterized protein n=1 Tax=Anopheles coluzzii TaxID=1518534 RepID=A0A8W7PAV7_ANOCL
MQPCIDQSSRRLCMCALASRHRESRCDGVSVSKHASSGARFVSATDDRQTYKLTAVRQSIEPSAFASAAFVRKGVEIWHSIPFTSRSSPQFAVYGEGGLKLIWRACGFGDEDKRGLYLQV